MKNAAAQAQPSILQHTTHQKQLAGKVHELPDKMADKMADNCAPAAHTCRQAHQRRCHQSLSTAAAKL
jgi:hypothetical protein